MKFTPKQKQQKKCNVKIGVCTLRLCYAVCVFFMYNNNLTCKTILNC